VSAVSATGEVFAPFLFNATDLIKQTPAGPRKIGQLTIYSDRTVALKRIKYSFIVILINSVVKTIGLWIIFYAVITLGLSRPLAKLTELVSRIKFASESNERISLDYPHQDELGSLAQSVNTMQERLHEARRGLEAVNAHLEETVAERTQRLSEALSFNETILYSSPLPMAVYASDGRCVLVNNACALLFATSRDVLLKQTLGFLGQLHLTGLQDACRAAIGSHTPQRFEIDLAALSGRSLWIECRILPTCIDGEDHLLIQFIDLTDRKRIEEELRHFAFHDCLTRMPNRRLLQDRLQQALRTSKRQDSHLAVLYLDMDRFKQLNDTYGHTVGDQMLIEVANRLQQVVRESDTVARLGGDEFVVLLEGLGGDQAQASEYATTVADKIRMILSEEYRLGEIRYRSTVSIGIKLVMGDDQGDPDQILNQADAAMYEAKKCRKAA